MTGLSLVPTDQPGAGPSQEGVEMRPVASKSSTSTATAATNTGSHSELVILSDSPYLNINSYMYSNPHSALQ